MCITLLIILSLTGCTGTWEHTTTAYVSRDILAGVAVASLACDGWTTARFERLGDHEENPVLGEHPSALRLWSYLGAIAAGVIVANVKLPVRWAMVLDGAVTLIEVESVAHNVVALGVPTCFGGTNRKPDPNTWIP